MGVGEGIGEGGDEGAVEEGEVGGGLASEIEGVSDASPLGCFMGVRLSAHSMKHLFCESFLNIVQSSGLNKLSVSSTW